MTASGHSVRHLKVDGKQTGVGGLSWGRNYCHHEGNINLLLFKHPLRFESSSASTHA